MKEHRIVSAVLLFVGISLAGCSPVIKNELMETGTRNVSLLEVRLNPDSYKGKVFVFGGLISGITKTPEGSLIEAQYISVDSEGYLTGNEGGKYLAVLPEKSGAFDPVVFHNGRKMTIAARFVQVRRGKSDEEPSYPLFEIEQIHLWEDGGPYYYPAGSYWRSNMQWWY